MIVKRKRKNQFYYTRKLCLKICDQCGTPFHQEHGNQLYCKPCGAIPWKSPKYRDAKIYFKKLKEEIFEHYGNRCAQCGEDDPIVFAIDHVNNDGYEERKHFKSQSVWMKVKRENFPETYQILCRNCNWRKHIKSKNQKRGDISLVIKLIKECGSVFSKEYCC